MVSLKQVTVNLMIAQLTGELTEKEQSRTKSVPVTMSSAV